MKDTETYHSKYESNHIIARVDSSTNTKYNHPIFVYFDATNTTTNISLSVTLYLLSYNTIVSKEKEGVDNTTTKIHSQFIIDFRMKKQSTYITRPIIYCIVTIGVVTAMTISNKLMTMKTVTAAESVLSASTGVVLSISDSIQQSIVSFYDAQLVRVKEYNTDPITKKVNVIMENDTTTATTLQSVTKDIAVPSLCFVIRRPGCILCREHAQQLLQLYSTTTTTTTTTAELKSKFQLWGIIKEIHVDDEGLQEFHTTYFDTLPLYYDVNNTIYKAFGQRSIVSNILHHPNIWNPIALYRSYSNLKQRLSSSSSSNTNNGKTKPLSGNYKGEGFIQGGLLFFDSKGVLRHSINEEIGTPFNLTEIQNIINTISNGESDNNNNNNNKNNIPASESVIDEL